VVTLAGYLIWQGVILGRLEVPGSIIIQDRWINYTANYYFSQTAGWLIAAIITGVYALAVLLGLRSAHGRQAAAKQWWKIALKLAGVAIAAFGVVAICNHGVVRSTTSGYRSPA
jgi:ABC-type xylose transport system permease subunit